MSEDGFSDPYDEPSMDLFVETLTGTSFEMRVYPSDTVLNIKNKIQRVEGIPVHQQNLLYRLKELRDHSRLCDIGVVNGSTVKLVLSMRGGPISTRRLSSCDHHLVWKDLKELIEHTRDEIGDKMGPGSKVSVLVLKEGEVINLIRVIENEDGSYSPYSEKPISPPGKVIVREKSVPVFYDKLLENNEMLEKITDLRQRMKNLSMKRNSRSNKSKTPLEEKDSTDEDDYSEEMLNASNLATYNWLNDLNNPPVADESDQEDIKYNISDNCPNETRVEHRNQMGDIGMGHRRADRFFVRQEATALKEKHGGPPDKDDCELTFPNIPYNRDIIEFPWSYSREKEAEKSAKDYKFSSDVPYLENEYNSIEEAIREDKIINSSFLSPLYGRYSPNSKTEVSRNMDLSSRSDSPSLCKSISILDEEDSNENKEVISPIGIPCAGTLSVSKVPARNRVRLAQLVLQEGAERPKSAADSLDVEDNTHSICDMILHEPSDRLKNTSSYKVGVLKRRQSVDYADSDCSNYSNSRNSFCSGGASEDHSFTKTGQSTMFSRKMYHFPRYFRSGASAIPPEYAPKDDRICDLYLGDQMNDNKVGTSPYFGRNTHPPGNLTSNFQSKSNINKNGDSYSPKFAGFNSDFNGSSPRSNFGFTADISSHVQPTRLPQIFSKLNANFLKLSSNIEKVRNEFSRNRSEESVEELYGRYNLGYSSDLDKLECGSSSTKTKDWYFAKKSYNSTDKELLRPTSKNYSNHTTGINRLELDDEIRKTKSTQIVLDATGIDVLPAVIQKKRIRCAQCNKRLNITSIYNCRCGGIFCSQHRYSEVHGCKYDYKTEGRKLIERQNPLVTANKLPKI